ncbi:MAG: 50S ribosomal protein L23 [Firmicutes bacterium]|nr:50S ribosomal protein L23 [Bacillota bacterium]
MMAAQDIIIKPLLSEKSYQGIQSKRYTFVVKKTANKTEIKLAVEEIFGVKVESVNTINVKGKKRRVGASQGYTSPYKKAIVQLKADSKSIEFFDSLS